MNKLEYNRRDKIYDDGAISESIYLIYKGTVKLYAENGYPFAIYRKGDTFGDIDVFCGTRRNGTAITTEDCLFYRVAKNKIDDILFDHPHIRQQIVEHALITNRQVTQQRLKVMTKNPIFGFAGKNQIEQKRAIKKIKIIKKQIDEKKKEMHDENYTSPTAKGTRGADKVDQYDMDDEEQDLVTHQQTIKDVNQIVEKQADSRVDFTGQVSRIANTIEKSRFIGTRDSLDFQYQKEKLSVRDQQRIDENTTSYVPSKKLGDLKQMYQANNELPSEEMIQKKFKEEVEKDKDHDVRIQSQRSDYLDLKESATSKLHDLKELCEVKEILKMNPEMNDPVTENSFEALVRFNEDMKLLALNAYQLHDLLKMVHIENNLILQLMSSQESVTLEYEEKI